ncbi:MAG: pyridoxamine 5'-phosphate oxidase family protein [Chitinophagaceae bacterium]|nr:pyridoxamine 5'-phosphate oxidase family protein [Chitinophagaceae bacterium]
MSTENLRNQEAIDKIKEMVDKIDVGMICSFTSGSDYPHAVPMSRQEVDEEGNIWFLFSSESETHRNLQRDNRLSLLYAHVGDYNFLSVNGICEISQDRERIDKYWNKMIEAWFEKGKEDPRIRVLKVIPGEAHYWDNKSNKLVTLAKIAASAISGQQLDIGREGKLSL